MRALGFEPTIEEIQKLIRDIGKEDKNVDDQRIDFQEFLEIMIVKMSQKDSEEDIEKAYNLFVDQEKNSITFASLKRVVEDLGNYSIYTNTISDENAG